MTRPTTSPLALFPPPYRRLSVPRDPRKPFPDPTAGPNRGTALVWWIGEAIDHQVFEAVQGRPGGIPLMVVLPPSDTGGRIDDLLRIVELSRPGSVLPYHPRLDPSDLRAVLARPPDNLAVEVTDYLGWRGISVDLETKRIIRRIIELSSELRTVSALARSVYLSRRALGRRFMNRGLPVPSHWLQMARLLRAAIRSQASEETLFAVAVSLGYPDGFSMSNQMKRLIGVRPSEARDILGWEWLLEAWLALEARRGNFAPEWQALLSPVPQRSQLAKTKSPAKPRGTRSAAARSPSS